MKEASRICNACNQRNSGKLAEVLSEIPSAKLLEMIVTLGMNTPYMLEVLQGKHDATASRRKKRVDAR